MNASDLEEPELSAPQETARPSYARTKRWCKHLVLAIFVVWGIQDALLPAMDSPNLLDLCVAIVGAFLCLTWCSADAAERQRRFGSGWKWLVLMLGLAGLTVYVLARRSAKTFFKGVGLALLAALGYIAAYSVTCRMYEGAWPEF